MDMLEPGCRWSEVSQRSDCMARDFGELAGLASLCPVATILLDSWPDEALCDQLCCCFRAGVRQAMKGLEHLEP
jgi:hypothetical protein